MPTVLEEEGPDILCLQECKAPVEKMPLERFADRRALRGLVALAALAVATTLVAPVQVVRGLRNLLFLDSAVVGALGDSMGLRAAYYWCAGFAVLGLPFVLLLPKSKR